MQGRGAPLILLATQKLSLDISKRWMVKRGDMKLIVAIKSGRHWRHESAFHL